MKLGTENGQCAVCDGQTNICWMNKQDATHNPTLQSHLHNADIHKVLDFSYKNISLCEWIKKMWHIYTMDYYSAIKRNEIELFVVRWMDL